MFSIRSTSSDRELEFLDLRGEEFTVELRGHGIQLTRDISTYTDSTGLVAFFNNLASIERPWDGSPKWASLEGEFIISASCSKLGEVLFSLEISGHIGAPEQWHTSFSLTSELGQLPKIANGARSFFQSPCA